MSKTSLTQKAFLLSGARCLTFLLTVFHPVILTRILSKGDYGTYSQFYLIVMTLIPLGEMGIVQGVYYFLPKSDVNKKSIAYQACLLITVTGFIVFGGILALDGHLAELIGNSQITTLVPFMAIYCFCGIASSAFEAFMIAEGNCLLASAFTLAMQFVNSTALIGGALASRSLTGIMTALCVASSLRLFLQYLYVWRRFGFPPRSSDFIGFGKTLSYILPTGAAGFIWSLQGKAQGFLVSALFSPTAFATYAVGTVSLPFVGIITATANNVMMPEITSSSRDALGRGRILSVWNAAIRKMNFILMPTFAFFFLVAEPLIVLMYTEQYRDSVTLFRLSLLTVLIASINNAAIIGGLGESRYLMQLSMVRLPLLLLILVGFSQMFGLAGVVLSNVIVSVLIILIEFRKVASLLDVRLGKLIKWGDNGKIFFAAAVACIPLYVIVTAGWSANLTLAAGATAYGAVYLAVVWVLALSSEEIALVKKSVLLLVKRLRIFAPASDSHII